MNNSVSIKYSDRNSGKVETEHPFASGFLYWSYNTSSGRMLTNYILSRRIISKIYGWAAKKKFSRRFITPFVKRNNICKDTIKDNLGSFNSFNSFFIRDINSSDRPIHDDESCLISPADGKILAYRTINTDETFQIKRNLFNLSKFLNNPELTDEFSGGSMVIIRLALTDNHHFIFPDSGFVYQPIRINGKLFAGGSYSLHRPIPFYTENQREITLINSDHFGLIAQVEIGAFTVGSIKQTFKPNSYINKGERKGYFELGGSTVVILFKKDALKIDHDLIINTQKGIETKVNLGEKIGQCCCEILSKPKVKV